MGVFHVLRIILGLVSMWKTERQTAKEGVKTRYRTPSKSDKKRAREKPSTYKAPESVKRLNIGRKSVVVDATDDNKVRENNLQATLPIDLRAPLELSNHKTYLCYANTIVQCALANPPLLIFGKRGPSTVPSANSSRIPSNSPSANQFWKCECICLVQLHSI